LIITGDITERGNTEQFDIAKEQIGEIIKAIGISKELVALVPGNHDVNRDKCEEAYNNAIKTNSSAVEKDFCDAPEKYEDFSKFFKQITGVAFNIQSPNVFKGFEKVACKRAGQSCKP